MAFYPSPIEQVHIELTDRCNAACPMCARNIMGGADNPDLPGAQISLDQARVIFEPVLMADLKRVVMCGDYGDPAVARDTLQIVRFLREAKPDLWISIHTNGSVRTPDWWRELGMLIPHPHQGKVVFGIDGLADTNHIYRRRTSFEKIMENASAFISGGGAAAWDYIAFRHNEHQIEDARALAARMGFFEFRVKKTYRFYRGYKGRWPVKDQHGAIEYWLEAPEQEQYRNDVASTPVSRCEIACKAAATRDVYVTSQGLVLPCCHLGYLHTDSKDGTLLLKKMIAECGGPESISALSRPIRDIVDGPLFAAIQRGWDVDPIPTCKFTCGRAVDLVEQQIASRHEVSA